MRRVPFKKEKAAFAAFSLRSTVCDQILNVDVIILRLRDIIFGFETNDREIRGSVQVLHKITLPPSILIYIYYTNTAL